MAVFQQSSPLILASLKTLEISHCRLYSVFKISLLKWVHVIHLVNQPLYQRFRTIPQFVIASSTYSLGMRCCRNLQHGMKDLLFAFMRGLCCLICMLYYTYVLTSSVILEKFTFQLLPESRVHINLI